MSLVQHYVLPLTDVADYLVMILLLLLLLPLLLLLLLLLRLQPFYELNLAYISSINGASSIVNIRTY